MGTYLKPLEKKLKEISNKISYGMAECLFNSVEDKYEEVIDKFYNSYTPKIYDRGHNLYYASTGFADMSHIRPVQKNIRKIKKGSHTVWVNISADNIKGEPYYQNCGRYYDIYRNLIGSNNIIYPKEIVLENSFEKGIRPNPAEKTWIKNMEKPPKKILDEWVSKEFKTTVLSSNGQAKLSGVKAKMDEIGKNILIKEINKLR